jgi:hypothetical protein
MEDQKAPFEVSDDAGAAWAMRKLQGLRRQHDEIEKVVAAEIATVTEWAERSHNNLARDLAYFEGLLINYAREQREQHGRKSIDLPTGRVTSRKSSEGWSVDSAEFVSWAKEFAPHLVRTKITELPETLDVLEHNLETSGGKVVVQETGEIVEGISVKDAAINYKVETNK